MAGRRDEVEEDVHTIVAEAWITLDARLFGQNVVVLSFEVTDNLGETVERTSVRASWCDLL